MYFKCMYYVIIYVYRHIQTDMNTTSEDPIVVNCKGHTGTLRVVAFDRLNSSSNVVYAASGGGGDNRPRVWDVNTGMCFILFLHFDMNIYHSMLT